MDPKRLVVDTETDDLNYTKIHVVVVRDLDTDEYEVFTGDKLNGLEAALKGHYVIGHHFLGFDWWVLYDLFGISLPVSNCIDTLCMSRLDDSNRSGGHSLERWGLELGVEKPVHEDWSVLSEAMIHRCVEDTKINAKLYRLLKNSLREKAVPWSEVELECFIQWKMKEVERNGFYFDYEAAINLRSELVDKRTRIERQLSSLFPPLPEPEREGGKVKVTTPTRGKCGGLLKRNLRGELPERFEADAGFCWVSFPEVSYTRDEFVKKHLLRAGWKPKVFTPTGKPKLDDELLDDIIAQVGEDYRPYQEWRILNTRITKQIGKWLEFYNAETSRQHGKIIHIGTRTHRMAHRDPPITQVPSGDSPYGGDCRRLWCVPEGKRLLGCDASGIQLRILAHYLQSDEWIIELVEGDVHTKNANILEVPRPKAKTFIYSFLLGAGIPKLAATIGKSIPETSVVYKRFIAETPGLKEFMDSQKKQAAKGWIRSSISQRWIPCQSDWHGDWLASLLQEGEATLMKRALKIWAGQASKKGLEYCLVTQNHDEWQTEVASEAVAEELGKLQVLSLQQAGRYYNCRCPIDGEYRIGKTWEDTH